MTIDFDGPEAIFRQLAGVLEQRIASGQYPPNRRIPSEAQIRDRKSVV